MLATFSLILYNKNSLKNEILEYTLLIIRFTVLILRFFSYAVKYLDSLKFSVEFKDIDISSNMGGNNNSDEKDNSLENDEEIDKLLML